MAFAHTGGNAQGFDFTLHTSFTLGLGSAVNAGDTMFVGLTADSTNPSGFSLTDSLGNSYTAIFNAPSFGGQIWGLFVCKVTNAGTPTLTVQFNPTPGTTTGKDVGILYDAFSGSSSGSTTDGSASNGQLGVGPGTDVVTSTNITTTHDGDLIYGITGNDTPVGTGFTLASTATNIGGAGGFGFVSEYKVQGTHGAVAATFSPTSTNDFETLAVAVTPAPPASIASDEGEIWLDTWKPPKPYVPTTTVYC